MSKEFDITERDERVDLLEATMLENFPIAECPINDIFLDGIYGREMLANKDTLIVSKIHRTEHLFILLKGKIAIFLDDGEVLHLEAPYRGVTKPGTRRVGYVIEDVVWLTIHANPDNESVDEIEERIIEPHTNELITDEMRQRIFSITNKS